MIVGSTLWQQSFFHLLSYLLSIWFYYTQNIPSKHSSWWRRLEDVFCLRLQKTSSRRLDQDEYVRLSLTSSEDVFKTSSRRLGQDQYIRLGYTSSRRLQDVFKTSSRPLQGVFKTSSRRLDQDEYVRLSLTSSEDVFKTSWSRPIYSSWPYVFKTSSRYLAKISSRGFQGVPSS